MVEAYDVNVYQVPAGGGTGSLISTQTTGINTASGGTCTTGSPTDPPVVPAAGQPPIPAPCAVFTGLQNGTSYYFTVDATLIGITTGTSTPSSIITPAGIPFPPAVTTVTNTIPAGGELTVGFTPPPTGLTAAASTRAPPTTSPSPPPTVSDLPTLPPPLT